MGFRVLIQRYLSMRFGKANASGMTVLELVFALAVFVLFAGVMAAISQQMQAYLGSDQSLVLAEDEQTPSPSLISWKLADRLHWLSQILDQPAIPDRDLLELSQCSTNPLAKLQLPVGMVANSSFNLDADAADSEFKLGSRYEICLLGPYDRPGPQNQQLFVLIAKPTSIYYTSPLLPVVRQVFCRPRPLCG